MALFQQLQVDMRPHVRIFALRSDGVLTTLGPSGQREDNRPTEEQMRHTTNEAGKTLYYKLLAHHDEKHRDWRVKLAKMLIDYMGTPEEKGMVSRAVSKSTPQAIY